MHEKLEKIDGWIKFACRWLKSTSIALILAFIAITLWFNFSSFKNIKQITVGSLSVETKKETNAQIIKLAEQMIKLTEMLALYSATIRDNPERALMGLSNPSSRSNDKKEPSYNQKTFYLELDEINASAREIKENSEKTMRFLETLK